MKHCRSISDREHSSGRSLLVLTAPFAAAQSHDDQDIVGEKLHVPA